MADSKTVNINIQYWGGWGYGRHAQAVKVALAEVFDQKVDVTLKKDAAITGNFEITTSSGELLHSKKGGKGFCKDRELAELITRIEDLQ